MKLWNKVFLSIIAFLVCISRFIGIHLLFQNRNLNWINVIWIVNWEISANIVKADITMSYTWFNQFHRNEKYNEEYNKKIYELKELLTWTNYRLFDNNQNIQNCNWQKCELYITSIQLSWNIEEAAKNLINKINDIDWLRIQEWYRISDNNNPWLEKLKQQANKSALNSALNTAEDLWISLWEIIVYSDENIYYHSRSSFLPENFNMSATVKVYHTYEIK